MHSPTSLLARVGGLALLLVLGGVPGSPGPALGAPAGPPSWPLPGPGRAGTDPVGEWPLVPEPEVVEGFDPPEDPWGAGHRGVDLLGSAGQPVRSALPGRVTFAGLLAGRGVVVVDHGPTRTTYEPVAATVTVGEVVTAGRPLGRLALTGSHCFPRACLHWGWLRGETYLDPLGLVGGGPVRLLPLWRDQPVAAGSTVRAPASGARPAYPGWRPLLAQARGCACW
jgi:murein DD-endopeptidase MepM/ murein hydrolase activator NlpD